MNLRKLDDSNFVLYAARHYENASNADEIEFNEDLARIKSLGKLFNRYMKNGELNDRLIMNHLIVLYNVFDHEAMTRMLAYRLHNYLYYLKPFLLLLGYWPEVIKNIGPDNEDIIGVDIPMDPKIVTILRNI